MRSSVERPAATPRYARRLWSFRAGLLIASLIIALVIAEVVVQTVRPQNMSGRWRERDSYGLRVHRRSNSAQHELGPRTVRYEFDDRGLRRMTADEGKLRIVCLGDSCTFGWLLEPQDTYLGLLQERVDRHFGAGQVVLLNAAHCGWGLAHCVDYLERYGNEHRPDAVLLFLSGDDIGRSLREPLYEIVDADRLDLRRRPPSKDLLLRKLAIAVPGYDWLLEHSHLLQLVRSAVLAPRFRERQRQRHAEQMPVLESKVAFGPEEACRMGRALFRRLRKWCDTTPCDVLVVTNGFHYRRGKPTAEDREPTRAFMFEAETILAEENIDFFDCSPLLDEHVGGEYDPLIMPLDGHPNERGAALVAEFNWPSLKELIERLQLERAANEVDEGT